MDIGERIKERREFLGLSQDELAHKVGYKSRSSIQKIETGKTDVSQTKISQIANALDTTACYLMGWKDYVDAASDMLVERRRTELAQGMNITDQYELNLIHAYRQLNDSGKLECMSHLDYLLTQERYIKDTESQDA